MIISGFTCDPGQRKFVEEKLQRTLPDELFNMDMQGHRMLIGMDRVDEMYKGLIQKPKSTIDAEQRQGGSGWVISVGPYAGQPGAPHPTGIVSERPEDLIAKHVYFGQWTGKVFRTDDDDQEFSGVLALVIMTDRDIQGYDLV